MAKFIGNLRAHPSCELKFNVYMQPFGLPANFGFTPPEFSKDQEEYECDGSYMLENMLST